MKDGFNSNFYITAATVIPLFYITLFLQSQLMQNLALRLPGIPPKMFDKFWSWFTRKYNAGSFVLVGIFYALMVLLFAAGYLILAAALVGIIAEGFSLWALYYQSDNIVMRAIVLWSMLGLLVLVSANPTITIVRNIFFESSGTSDEKPDSTDGGETGSRRKSE